MSRIVGKKFIEALLESGVITRDEFVRRVVIDVSYDDAVVMHVERYGDSRLLEVIPALTGVEIRREAPVAWTCPCHPNAHWGFFADYAGCPISDLYYADPASTTYGTQYADVAALESAHPGVRPVR